MSAAREARRGGHEGIAENVFVVCFRPVSLVKRRVHTGRHDPQTAT